MGDEKLAKLKNKLAEITELIDQADRGRSMLRLR